MIQTVRKAWAIPELRKKIIFTLLILLIYRIGNAISVPYVNVAELEATLNSMGTTYLGLLNVMSGGAFAMATVFALGIQPYINSSIIIQLLTVAIPPLERLARDGGGRGQEEDSGHHPLCHSGNCPFAGVWVLYDDAKLQSAHHDRCVAGDRHYRILCGRRIFPDVAGRAGQRVWRGQRHLHDPVCRYYFPRPLCGQQHDHPACASGPVSAAER